MMDVEWLRKTCLEYPGATEQIQWGNDLLFKVGGKMFAIAPLEPAPVCLTFKCSEESFADLTERPAIIPAPYLARAKWVALETAEALSRAEIAALIGVSYQLVFAKLPKSVQKRISEGKRRPGARQGQKASPSGKGRAKGKGKIRR
jgi:predicted DNA-binding protein (MmcQ/YjbR family)